MPSTIPLTVVEIDNGNGITAPLPGVTVKVYSTVTSADVATVVTDAEGFFPATAVADPVGSTYRLRIESYQGKAAYFEILSV